MSGGGVCRKGDISTLRREGLGTKGAEWYYYRHGIKRRLRDNDSNTSRTSGTFLLVSLNLLRFSEFGVRNWSVPSTLIVGTPTLP